MSGNERRAHQRFEIQLGAEIRTAERSFSAATKDVSVGGACIEGPYALEETSAIDLDLFVVVDGVEEAGFPPLTVRARVQWTAETDDPAVAWRNLAGLRFEELDEAKRQWLERVLARTS